MIRASRLSARHGQEGAPEDKLWFVDPRPLAPDPAPSYLRRTTPGNVALVAFYIYSLSLSGLVVCSAGP